MLQPCTSCTVKRNAKSTTVHRQILTNFAIFGKFSSRPTLKANKKIIILEIPPHLSMLPHYLVKGNGQAPGTRSTRDNLLFSLQLRQMFASFFNVRHTRSFNGPLYGTNHVSRYQRGKQIWILLKQETVSGSGNSWARAICKSAPRSRQIIMPAPHHSVFTGLPAAQQTTSKQ